MRIVVTAKSVAQRAQPSLYDSLRDSYQSLRRRRHRRYLEHVDREIIRRMGRHVHSGPFKGMRYIETSSWDHIAPKLIGSYESELHGIIERLVQKRYHTIVDIGCAEGYYAVGLALRMEQARVYAFDIDADAQNLCARLARENRVEDRVVVRGECNPEMLNTLTGSGALVVADCEGAELALLNPDLCPNLAATDILVELHDFVNPAISQTILNRFSTSHDVALVSSVSRDPRDYPGLRFLGERRVRCALDELRPGIMQWAVLTSRGGQR